MEKRLQTRIDRCNALIQANQKRVTIQQEMEDEFLLKKLPGIPNDIKDIKDPQPHNSVVWAVGSLAKFPPEPRIEIPVDVVRDKADVELGDLLVPVREGEPPEEQATKRADILENIIKVILQHNDARLRAPLYRDTLLSAFLAGSVTHKIYDLRYNKSFSKRLKGRSPFQITCCNAKNIFTEWDSIGLCHVLERYKKTWREIKQLYPNAKGDYKDDDELLYNCSWTEEDVLMWCEPLNGQPPDPKAKVNVSEPSILWDKENALGFIPFVEKVSDGSNLFDLAEKNIFPILYAGTQTNLFRRTDLILSVLATVAFAQANPQYFQKKDDPNTPTIKLKTDKSYVHGIGKNDEIGQFQMGVPDAVQEVAKMMMDKAELSSIQRSVGSGSGWEGSPASLYNMVLHSAEIKLNPAQVAVAQVYVEDTERIFDWMRAYDEMYGKDAEELTLWIKSGTETLSAKDLPEWMDIQYIVKPNLPQDRMMLSKLAYELSKELFISRETAWELSGIVDDKNKEKRRLQEQMKEQPQPAPIPEQGQVAQVGALQPQGLAQEIPTVEGMGQQMYGGLNEG